ncbi:MAG: HPr(Ser) kinase/phosphatase [Spirochaetia bacterium]|nr:HPr(Ser) kinase/phosphatase [Spirochaetia bacterium]
MAEKTFTVLNLLELDLTGHDALELKCIAGKRGLPRKLTVADINRPGLAISGFYENFAFQRVQLFGRGEVAYLNKLYNEKNTETIKKFFEYEIPCCVFSQNRLPSQDFLDLAEKSSCPILQTTLESSDFSSRLLRIFSNIFAPKKSLHGVLIEVYGMGILLRGHSGVGKSETALELIERGHRLVADDVVEVRCVNGNIILGQVTNSRIGHYMEIRGLGIIDITQLYGIGAVRAQKEIQLVMHLEEWDNTKEYDRLGLNQEYTDILGVKIPLMTIPVKPGRNLPTIIEAAAMNERLKKTGRNSSKEFNQNILRWIEIGSENDLYLNGEDTY